MLKFSGYSCLISDTKKVGRLGAAASTSMRFTLRNVTAALSAGRPAAERSSAFVLDERSASLALRFG